MRSSALVLLALAFMADHAIARGPRPSAEELALDKGARVRIATSREGELTGRVEKLTKDALVIRLDEGSRVVSFSLAEITRIELSNGRRSRGQSAWSKAKWGALIGAVPGAISLGLQHEQIGENGRSVGEAAAIGAWSGGLFGGLIGALIGALNPAEGWETITPTFQIGTGRPGDSGFSFSVTVGF